MSRKTKRGENIFQESWLSKYDWVKKKSKTHVTCTLCNTDLSFVNMGESTLSRHEKPNPPDKEPSKHQKRLEERRKIKKSLSILHFKDVTKSQSSSLPCSQSSSQSSSLPCPQSSSQFSQSIDQELIIESSLETTQLQPTLELYMVPLTVAQAEIRWTMKVVMNHFSLRSCINIKELFMNMFPDSEICQKFALSKTKCGYYINFGLAPYFKEELENDIKASPFYTILFDESMNRISQSEQMDVFVRYWCGKNNKVESRYYDSQFLNRANADNIVEGIDKALKNIPKDDLIHVGMDGPHTNWSVYGKVQERRKERNLSVLEDLGSCGLHSVNGALGTGVQCSSWPLKKVLKSLFNLFHDSPARRDIYVMINSSKVFPQSYCPTRWVENESVAERALETWDHTKKVIEHYEALPKYRRPNNSSYNTLLVNQKDVLMKVKIQVFKDIAHKTKQFLTVFQTDGPMVPFLAEALEILIRRLMTYFISNTVLKKTDTQWSLVNLDVSVTGGKCLQVGDIKLPTASKSMLTKVKLSADGKAIFMKQYRDFLIGMVQKLQERSPLKYDVVRSAAAFDPVNMADCPTKSCKLFEELVEVLFDHKRFTSSESEDVKIQYDDFLDNVVCRNKDVFSNFDFTKTRVDEFLSVYLVGEKKFALLFKVLQFVCILSHGQATIERGFNVNKEVLVENLLETSLVSQRLVYDQLRSFKSEIHEIEIPRKMVLSCKAAHKKYMLTLEEKKKNVEDKGNKVKRTLKQEEVMSVKRQKVAVEKVVSTLKEDIEQISVEASTKKDFESMKLCLQKANSFRDVLKGKVEMLTEFEKAIRKLEEELELLK